MVIQTRPGSGIWCILLDSFVWEKRETLLRTFIQNETMNTNNEKAVPINGSILQKPNEALSRVY